jgi:hypothetical protein
MIDAVVLRLDNDLAAMEQLLQVCTMLSFVRKSCGCGEAHSLGGSTDGLTHSCLLA